MEAASQQASTPQHVAPRWKPLPREARRVAGVLVEKAKTTPENYPLSRNAIVNGCNQKSNRFPQMQLDEDQVEEALEHLRLQGAVAEIQGDGRVDKYRHLLYEWLGVDKTELAVMAELLLRGAQTLGDLRGRAARMEAIKDIVALGPIVDSLHAKGLLLYLSPPGRGAVVTHALYEPQELDKIRGEHGGYQDDGQPTTCNDEASPETPQSVPRSIPTPPPSIVVADVEVREELAQLRAEINALRSELTDLKSQLGA